MLTLVIPSIAIGIVIGVLITTFVDNREYKKSEEE